MRKLIVGLLVSVVMAMPTGVRAGGWWSFVQAPSRYLAIGETVTLQGEDVFESAGDRRKAFSGERQFFVYLLQGTDREMVDEAMGEADPGDWWTPPERGVPLGRVEFAGHDQGIYNVRTDVQIPDVAPGKYELMYCTDRCQEPLTNHVPLEVTIVEATAAGLVKSDRRAQEEVERLISSRSQVRAELRGLEKKWVRSRAAGHELDSRVEGLETRLAADRSEDELEVLPLALAFLAGAVLVKITGAFRRGGERGRVDDLEEQPEA